MRDSRSVVAGFALVVASALMGPGRAQGQAVAFFPGVGTIPDGVNLSVTPVVSADRRYVRLSLDVNFSTINGFTNFPVPAAVGGGGNGGGLRGGLGGLGGGGGGGNAGGGNGGGAKGFNNVMGGAGLADSGVPYRLEYLEANRKAEAQDKAIKAKPIKGKKPLPDPVVVPIKKGEAKAPGAPRG